MLSDPPTHPKAHTSKAQASATACAGRAAVAEGFRDTIIEYHYCSYCTIIAVIDTHTRYIR